MSSDEGATRPGPSKGKDAGQSGEEKAQETLGQGSQPEQETGAAAEEEILRVYFNLDTTGFRLPRHITQIAAKTEDGDTWSCFVKPQEDIEDTAEERTTYNRQEEQMYYDGHPVDSFGIDLSLRKFIDFLRQLGRPVLLICQSEKNYHSYALTEALIACNLVKEFQAVFFRWLDVRLFFKQAEGATADIFSLKALYERHTGKPFTAHDSRGRVAALSEIFEQKWQINVNPKDKDYTSTLDYTLKRITWREAVDRKDSRDKVVVKKAATGYTARKASKNGTGWDDVQKAYQEGGEERVTERLGWILTKPVIDRMLNYIKDQSENKVGGPKVSVAEGGQPHQASGEEMSRVLYFNVDITGFGHPRRITQIAAKPEGGRTWNLFVNPKKDIEDEVQLMTRINYNRKEKQMFYHGHPVDSFGINQSLDNFIAFLREQKGPVLLVWHSEKSYDSYTLIEALIACNLVGTFRQVFYRALDVMLLFQQAEGHNAEQGNNHLTLAALYERYTTTPFTARESRGRVEALSEIFEQSRHIAVDPDDTSYTFTLDYLLDQVTEDDVADQIDEEAEG